MVDDDGEVVSVRLPIRVRRTEYGRGERSADCSIHCPISKDSQSLEHCLECPNRESATLDAEAPSIWCRVRRPDGEGNETNAVTFEAKLERARVAEVMTLHVVCVDPDLGLDEVAQILEENRLRAAPVVDEDGVLIGMVSKSDLVRGRSSHDAPEEGSPRFPPDCLGRTVEDVMTRDVVKLPESASLGQAARLFAQSGLHHVPVVSGDDVVVGILSVIDLIRWVVWEVPPGPRRAC